jgi:predicted nucleic acid-binding protein
LLNELHEKLLGKFRLSPDASDDVMDSIFQSYRIIRATPLSSPVSRDPDDDAVLAIALTGGCELIITGDKDLLALGAYEGIRILSPGAFWADEHPQA